MTHPQARRTPTVSVLLPTLNEAQCLETVLAEMPEEYRSSVLVVDGGSVDGTPEVARRLGARVIRQEGRGLGRAIATGTARTDGDIVVVVDADGSYHPGYVRDLVARIRDGADLVVASRYSSDVATASMFDRRLRPSTSDDDTPVREFGNRFLTWLCRVLVGVPVHDALNGLKAFRREVVSTVGIEEPGQEYDVELLLKAHRAGFRIAEIPVVERARIAGVSKLSVPYHGWRILRVILAQALRRAPGSPAPPAPGPVPGAPPAPDGEGDSGGGASALTVGALTAATLVGGAVAAAAGPAEWPAWRGPGHDGASPETGLVASWSREGENLSWRADFRGRSTPVVFNGRVCATGRAGDGIGRQELVACFDAATGKLLWERRFPVYHTTVPWNRVGWASPAADPETGYLYVQGVGGLFHCLDREGRTVWSRSFEEELGFYSGYGGRTQTPALVEDRVIVTFSSSSWGEHAVPRHRLFALDKRTGELLWISTPGGPPYDLNSQSTPVAAEVAGRQLVVHGNADGWIYAVDAQTGEERWGFRLSLGAINTSVVVDGTTVYAGHGEENVDGPELGRVVAIDATGEGDVTATHERWRAPLAVGFASPALHGDRLYVVDGAANLHALDARSGRVAWSRTLGTVGRGSPVVADGKIYVTEVNGGFHVLEPGAESARVLDSETLQADGNRPAEIYGSPAVAYGRVYFTTEEGLYCLGDPEGSGGRDGRDRRAEARSEAPAPEAGPAESLVAVPAETVVRPGESVQLTVRAFDESGRRADAPTSSWSLDGLAGELTPEGRFIASPDLRFQAGRVVARSGGMEAAARIRVIAEPPWEEDFEAYAENGRPPNLLGSVEHFRVREDLGGRVLVKAPSPAGIHRHTTYLGRPGWSGYTIEADLLATRSEHRIPDMGLVNQGYTLDLKGAHQELQIRSWTAELRMAREVPFPWSAGTWYTMKLRVDVDGGRATVRGKVWPREAAEPARWTIVAEDPHPIEQGSPGLYGYSPTPVLYDNVRVTVSR